MIDIKIHNKSYNSCPEYSTDGSSGMDIKAFLKKNVMIRPMHRKIIHTGLFFEIPKGYEAQIRSRSGLALKYGIIVLNDPGTIDSDYRGELKIILMNVSRFFFTVKNGDRIAQIIFLKYEKIKWKN
ncbi:dUTP diphosphatase [Blattabacterium cuenoti]|uniref:dUTP diphosphatase n=1 Tax=Blattabacterium cuenoti TaxID=1653831 RepID=UPI00163BE047|nr:dUTP diphosphatase [Blattabacterium cuenoti]